jgi:hypothetical protein
MTQSSPSCPAPHGPLAGEPGPLRSSARSRPRHSEAWRRTRRHSLRPPPPPIGAAAASRPLAPPPTLTPALSPHPNPSDDEGDDDDLCPTPVPDPQPPAVPHEAPTADALRHSSLQRTEQRSDHSVTRCVRLRVCPGRLRDKPTRPLHQGRAGRRACGTSPPTISLSPCQPSMSLPTSAPVKAGSKWLTPWTAAAGCVDA